jgi:hypothetical protein
MSNENGNEVGTVNEATGCADAGGAVAQAQAPVAVKRKPGRPKLPPELKRDLTTIAITVESRAILTAYCKRRGITHYACVSDLIVKALGPSVEVDKIDS